jgi:hypothetical protein
MKKNKKNRTLSEGEIAEHDARIRSVLQRAYDEHGVVAVTDETPATILMGREVDFDMAETGPGGEYGWPGGVNPRLTLHALKREEASEVAYVARRDLVRWVAGDGLHPFKVVQRFYALVYASFPEICGDMDGSWFAEILGQGRAAFSALMGRLFGSVAQERLGAPVKVAGQKSAKAAGKYAENARRNAPKRQMKGDAGCPAAERAALDRREAARRARKLEEARAAAERRDLERDAAEFKRITKR